GRGVLDDLAVDHRLRRRLDDFGLDAGRPHNVRQQPRAVLDPLVLGADARLAHQGLEGVERTIALRIDTAVHLLRGHGGVPPAAACALTPRIHWADANSWGP